MTVPRHGGKPSGWTGKPFEQWSDFETGWVAALLEGEGTFSAAHMNKPPSPKTPRVGLAMTDADVVQRYAGLIGKRVTSKPVKPTALGNPRKPQWQVSVYGAGAIALMSYLAPHMGHRRAARIEELTAEWFTSRPHLKETA